MNRVVIRLPHFWSGVLACLLTMTTLAACANPLNTPSSSSSGGDLHKIKHIIIIMQENRSFDSYFGTYPGADGIPMQNGVSTVCINDPQAGHCVKPYHDAQNLNHGGPHGAANATADIDGGKMDGFIAQAERGKGSCVTPNDPACSSNGQTDVMGYHTAQDIPNYWNYAKSFVLQDHLFEPDASWSLPAHLFMVSAWSAKCSQKGDPQSCVNNIQGPVTLQKANTYRADYAWTDLTYLLHKANVSWGYYVAPGTEPDCEDDAASCSAVKQGPKTPGIWNPLPDFDTVQQDGQLSNVQSIDHFVTAAKDGSLPAVSWVTPDQKESEHPPALISIGQAYVTTLINAVMHGPDWNSSAIMLAWDDWGGFYDHVVAN